MSRFFLLLLIVCILPLKAGHALTKEKGSDAADRTIVDYIKDFVDVPEGALDWKIFGKTKEIRIEGKTKEGYDTQYYKPEFTPELKALDGQEVTIKGYMFPLGPGEKQNLFLFGPFPVNCPFHYHTGPSLVIEAYADANPVRFSYDPIILKGKLELVLKDEENSTFYRLKDVKQLRSKT